MAIYGYARCSTSEDKQDINRQVRELKASGAEEVIFEYEHGDAKVKKELHAEVVRVVELFPQAASAHAHHGR